MLEIKNPSENTVIIQSTNSKRPVYAIGLFFLTIPRIIRTIAINNRTSKSKLIISILIVRLNMINKKNIRKFTIIIESFYPGYDLG